MNVNDCPVRAGQNVDRGWLRNLFGCTEIKRVGEPVDFEGCMILPVEYTNGHFGLVEFMQGGEGVIRIDDLTELRSDDSVCNALIRKSSAMPTISFIEGEPLHVSVLYGEGDDAARWSLGLYSLVGLPGQDTYRVSDGS